MNCSKNDLEIPNFENVEPKKNNLMRKAILSFLTIGTLGFITACGGGENTNVVESGTYEGTIAKVKPDEREIYVNYEDKKLELYFTDSTQLMHKGESVDFSKLKEDQKVSVKVEKMGKKLNPLKVNIME